MYNKEKFHNTLALALGHRIVKDKRLDISVDDSKKEAPIVTISVVGTSMKIECVASEEYIDLLRRIDNNEQLKAMGLSKEVMNIIKSANTAYRYSLKELATSR
jgi:hypothetical protein